MNKFVLTVQCVSTRGVVAAIAGYLAERGCSITGAAQFDDIVTRMSFNSEEGKRLERCAASSLMLPLGMDFAFHDEAEKTKVVIMVSRFGHCFDPGAVWCRTEPEAQPLFFFQEGDRPADPCSPPFPSRGLLPCLATE